MMGAASPTRARVRDQRGLTLIETMVAVLVTAVGLLGTVGALVSASKTTSVAERHEVGVHQAQLALERMRAVAYDDLSLPSSVVPPPTPANDVIPSSDRVAFTAFTGRWLLRIKITPFHRERLIFSDEPGVIPGAPAFPSTFNVNGTTGKIFYYVTWRGSCGDQACNGNVVGDTTPYDNSKRLTVAVTLDPVANGTGPATPIWISTVEGPPVDDESGGVGPPDQNDVDQLFYLYDKQCGPAAADNTPPTTASSNHTARDTAAKSTTADADLSSSCWSTNQHRRPDLMGPAKPNWAAPAGLDTAISTPFLPKYDQDFPAQSGSGWTVSSAALGLSSVYPGGLPLARSTTDTCPTSYDVSSATASAARRNIHRWVTAPFTKDFSISGLVRLNLYTHTLSDWTGQLGALCITVQRVHEDAGSQSIAVQDIETYNCGPMSQWPQTPYSSLTYGELRTRRWCEFFLYGKTIAAGDRLGLVVSVPSTSDRPPILFYGDPDVPTNLRIKTITPCGGADAPC